jgi:hypothetical protein
MLPIPFLTSGWETHNIGPLGCRKKHRQGGTNYWRYVTCPKCFDNQFTFEHRTLVDRCHLVLSGVNLFEFDKKLPILAKQLKRDNFSKQGRSWLMDLREVSAATAKFKTRKERVLYVAYLPETYARKILLETYKKFKVKR